MCFDEKIEFSPTFREEFNASGMDEDAYTVTVVLTVVYEQEFDEYEEVDDDEDVCDHSDLLELWKVVEICMTGESVYMSEAEQK